jgi:hypothetical protein
VSFTGSRTGGVDLLTRTTLEMDRATPAASVANLIRTLQSVPGVLLAESTAGTARVVVAHDAGVAESSLLEAARRAGVRAKIAHDPAETLLGIAADPSLGSVRLRNRLAISMAAFAALVAVDALVPGDKHWIMTLLVVALGIFLFVEAFAGRRRA